MTFSLFFQSLINGLNLGATYALIALGYTMVYGIIRMINFRPRRLHHDRRLHAVLHRPA